MKTWHAIVAAVGLGLVVANAPKVGLAPRGIRNNNPGNIRRGTADWLGMVSGDDQEFVTFSHPVYGIRAMARVLKNYQRIHGLKTVREIINRWAPPVENDTGAYVEHVAKSLGVDPDRAVHVPQILPALVAMIIRHENGVQPYSSDLIAQGVAIA